MSQIDRSRRIALQTLLLGAAGAAVTACGGKDAAPAGSNAPAASTPPAPEPAAPAPAPAAAATDATATAAPAAPAAAPATGALAPLDPKEPQALALGYVTDASTLDPAKNAPYQPGRHCATCVQYKGAADSVEGPCGIFVGKSVKAAGWCKVWAPRAA